MLKSEKNRPRRRKKHASKLAFSVSFNRHSSCLAFTNPLFSGILAGKSQFELHET